MIATEKREVDRLLFRFFRFATFCLVCKPYPGFCHPQKERLIGRILRILSEPNALACVPAIIVSRGHAAVSPSFGCYPLQCSGTELVPRPGVRSTLPDVAPSLPEPPSAPPQLRTSAGTRLRRRANTHGYWSVWILIGAIWISGSCVVGTAAAAIVYILR